MGGNLLRSYGVLRERERERVNSVALDVFPPTVIHLWLQSRKNRVFVVFKTLILSVCREAMRSGYKESSSRTKTVIKFSK